jgi:hypothetical protein
MRLLLQSVLIMMLLGTGCKSIVSVEPYKDWQLKVNAGRVPGADPSFKVHKDVVLEVPVPQLVQVRGERYDKLPIWTPRNDRFGWMQGERLASLMTDECTAPGLLVPGSVKVRLAKDANKCLVEKVDYFIDPLWGAVGRAEKGSISESMLVTIDYDYYSPRLDSVMVTNKGEVVIHRGISGVNRTYPIEPNSNETAIANIWLYGHMKKLTAEAIYPIERTKGLAAQLQRADKTQAEKFLPHTLAKLRSGKPLTILAWGDSVTAMGEHDPNGIYYQNIFVRELKNRFPKARITLRTAAWPGSKSRMWFETTVEAEHNFQRDCIDLKPDLVTIEFVNDADLNETETIEQYKVIMDRFLRIDSEVILIAPHYIRPDWMGADTLKLDDDPRPYVKALREFACEHNIALADASKYWGRLWREGVPYIIYLPNSINHPNVRGHELFVKALMELFPSE